jgi:uncharacterized protein
MPRIVLDTNAVLDWLVFNDSGITALAQAIARGTVQWIATPHMREELARVLAYPTLRTRNPDVAAVQRAWVQHAHPCPTPTACTLRCSDADDQPFIDLAIAQQATWLVSKDKALLALKKKALAHGVRIVRPEQWCSEDF